MSCIDTIKIELNQYINNEKADFFPKFFKTGIGEYGEGDKFIGVTVPNQRKIARKYYIVLELNDVEMLLREPIHEYRMTALFILCLKYEKTKEDYLKESIVNLYLNNLQYVNNWDLVDSSAYLILGPHLINNNKEILYEFARSNDLWKQRIAIITTLHFIRNNKYKDTLRIAEILLKHNHDLIHKAVGWMLREIGNRNLQIEIEFLQKHYKQMPRTMLRYAIEKFDEELRQKFLKGLV